MLLAAGVSAAVFLFAVLFFYQVHADPLSYLSSSHAATVAPSSGIPGKVYLSTESAPVAAAVPQIAPVLEIHIAGNGLVLLRGARVASISGSTINVAMAWGSSNFTWAVGTSYNTQFLTSTGQKESLQNIQVGDIITVTGMLANGGTGPAVDAQFVRE